MNREGISSNMAAGLLPKSGNTKVLVSERQLRAWQPGHAARREEGASRTGPPNERYPSTSRLPSRLETRLP